MPETFIMLLIFLVAAVVAVRFFAGSGPNRQQLKQEIERAQERTPPDIREIVRQEIEDLGVNRMSGGDGIDLGVVLRVWKRDASIRQACSDGIAQFQVRPGTSPADASDLDVRVVCVPVSDDPPPWQDPPAAEGPFDEPAPLLGTDDDQDDDNQNDSDEGDAGRLVP